MKKIAFLLTYIAALVIGVLFLIFSPQATATEASGCIRGLMTAVGIILIIPGFVSLIKSMVPQRDANGVIKTLPWYITACSIASLAWGIMILCIPSMDNYLSITLGITLIVAALGQVIFIVQASRPYGASLAWYVIPLCVLGVGIVDMCLVNDYQSASIGNGTAAIITGIALLFWAANGLLSLNYKRRSQREVIDTTKTDNPKE